MEKRTMPLTSKDIRFSNNHGQNVVLRNSGRTARYRHGVHSGKLYISKPLKKHDTTLLSMKNSGRVIVGVMHSKPGLKYIQNVHESPKYEGIPVVCNISHSEAKLKFERVHSGYVTVTTSDGKGSNSVDLNVPKKESVYIVMEICTGNVIVRLLSDNAEFDQVCGPDINFHRRPRKFASLLPYNVESICSVQRPFNLGEHFRFDVGSMTGTTGEYVKLYLSHEDGHAFITTIKTAPYLKIGAGESYSVWMTGEGTVTYTKGDNCNGNAQTTTKAFPGLTDNKPVYVHVKLYLQLAVTISSELATDSNSGTRTEYIYDEISSVELGTFNVQETHATENDISSPIIPRQRGLDPSTFVGNSADVTFSELIRNNYTDLLAVLDLNPLEDFLVQYDFMSPSNGAAFLDHSFKARLRYVLDILMRKPNSKDTFIKALKYHEHPQLHILDMLGLE